MKTFSCADLGNDCSVIITAPTEERLVELASVHLRDVHGATALSADTLGRIKQHFVNRTTLDAAYVVDRIFEKYNCDRDPECTLRYIAAAEMILAGGAITHKQELKAA